MTCSSFRLKIIAAAIIVNVCPLVVAAAQTSRDSDTSPRAILEKARASIVVLTGEDKAGLPVAPGLGFWIGSNLIATDNRVVQSAVRIHVRAAGQESNTLERTFRDTYRSAAILTAMRSAAPPLPLGDSDKVSVDDRVYVVSDFDSNVAVSEGTVREITTINDRRLFEITARILNTGIGGPVFNSKGEVIGIASGSLDGQSVGFALPAASLTTLLRYRNAETSSGGMGSDRVPGAGPGHGSNAGGMGSDKRPGAGPSQGSKVPGGNAQPAGEEPIPLAATPVDTKPVVIKNGQPRYTEEAHGNQTQGVVSVRILVGKDGEVKRASVTKGLPDGLIEEAIASAYQMKFKPAKRNGEAVSYWMAIQVEFNLR